MNSPQLSYRGRFAPSPTGPLHLGSLVCALATWLDARAHDGEWILRIEDIDPYRDKPEYARSILHTLQYFGFCSDAPVVFQSERNDCYEKAFETLKKNHQIYPCTCSRAEVMQRAQELGIPPGIYPGTCRNGAKGTKTPAWRFLVDTGEMTFRDRIAGPFTQDLRRSVGDFVVRRADHCWAYQLAVVVDDALQGITHIVRGADLLDNTPRQMLLQRALDYPTPSYAHIALVKNPDGTKLSKQTRAAAVVCEHRVATLDALMPHLGLPTTGARSESEFFLSAIRFWKETYIEGVRSENSVLRAQHRK